MGERGQIHESTFEDTNETNTYKFQSIGSLVKIVVAAYWSQISYNPNQSIIHHKSNIGTYKEKLNPRFKVNFLKMKNFF